MGRKPSLTDQEIQAVVNSLAPPKLLAEQFGVSIATIYRYQRLAKRSKGSFDAETVHADEEVF